MKLLVASTNQGKIEEIRTFLQDLELDIISLGQIPDLPEVLEDGSSFAENALKKARARADETGYLTLADDSGLEVDSLNGEPGIYSARYAGPAATDSDNNRKLLQELKGLPIEKRKARFRCVIALVDPGTGEEYTVEGICNGLIREKTEGQHGFGYDPLFQAEGYQQTMAQLPVEVKNKISHRAKALKRIKEVLKHRYSEVL